MIMRLRPSHSGNFRFSLISTLLPLFACPEVIRYPPHPFWSTPEFHIWQEISPVFLGDTFVPWVHPYMKYKGKGYRKGTTQNHWKMKVTIFQGNLYTTKVHWVHWVHNGALPLADWSQVHAHHLPVN